MGFAFLPGFPNGFTCQKYLSRMSAVLADRGSTSVTSCCPPFDCVIPLCHSKVFVPVIEAIQTAINLVLSRAHQLSGPSQKQFNIQALSDPVIPRHGSWCHNTSFLKESDWYMMLLPTKSLFPWHLVLYVSSADPWGDGLQDLSSFIPYEFLHNGYKKLSS